MKKIPNPIIHEIDYSEKGLKDFDDDKMKFSEKNREYLIEYPTVYVINNKTKSDRYSVYIGETTDIRARTSQHLNTNEINKELENSSDLESSLMYVIGHQYFNKSLTLDIENKLMHYLSTVDKVDAVYNKRTNQQNKYYTSEYLEEIFSKVWRGLRRKNKSLFPLQRIIEDSALFKASPFHKLTLEQVEAKEKIYNKVVKTLKNGGMGELVLVSGEAGSGKTVLMSSLFYDLVKELPDIISEDRDIKVHMLVNHDEQLNVYTQIAKKLGIYSESGLETVVKPTRFINQTDIDSPVDVVIVDEAHLLLTQGKQSYQGKNHLNDLLKRSKVVVAVLDIHQVLTTEQYLEPDEIKALEEMSKKNDNYIYLTNQMRIDADEKTIQWIRYLVHEHTILNIPHDSKGYELKVFDSAADMHEAISLKNEDNDKGLSRVVATFDWPYKNPKKPENEQYWMVRDGDFEMPWNYQLKAEKRKGINYKNLSWAEQPHTINEIGSIYTIQGFDLNYVGVIIGPSVKYREGQIIYDKDGSENTKVTQRRTLKDGSKADISDFLLKNQLNVLLTRGVHGLYIYAVDKQLREALLKAQQGEIELG